MGLAGAKNRRKLGNDPNNTKWSKNTDSFGHRMLRSQGWEPGQYLGPKESSHAVYHTAASASSIRVALKEDNLGLGASINRGNECTGLYAFKEMLARLNGKSEAAIETERKAKEDYQRSLYVERKFGAMRFVSGGFLVGDAIKGSNVEEEEGSGGEQKDTDHVGGADAKGEKAKKEKKSKKRKAEDREEVHGEERRMEKKKRRKQEASSADDGEEGEGVSIPDANEDTTRKEVPMSMNKKDKKDKKEKKCRKEGAESDDGDTSLDKAKRREKRKEERRKRKETLSAGGSSTPTDAEDSNSNTARSRESTTAANTAASTPAGSGTSTPMSGMSARHLARRRFIAQKRMALTDQQALNQIFMIKS